MSDNNLSAKTAGLIEASEPIGAGDFVALFENDGGRVCARRAIATDLESVAVGFVLSAFAKGDVGPVHFFGINSAAAISRLSEVWLSDSVAGAFQRGAPTEAGHIIQSLGTAIPNVGIVFHLGGCLKL